MKRITILCCLILALTERILGQKQLIFKEQASGFQFVASDQKGGYVYIKDKTIYHVPYPDGQSEILFKENEPPNGLILPKEIIELNNVRGSLFCPPLKHSLSVYGKDIFLV